MVDSLQKKSCVSLHEDLFQIAMGYLQMRTFNTQINPFSPVDLFPQPLQLSPFPRPVNCALMMQHWHRMVSKLNLRQYFILSQVLADLEGTETLPNPCFSFSAVHSIFLRERHKVLKTKEKTT